jgi:hypothetical protein
MMMNRISVKPVPKKVFLEFAGFFRGWALYSPDS